jgi:hypothetical protein
VVPAARKGFCQIGRGAGYRLCLVGLAVALEIVMRSAGNFSPEWGYLAPAPSFMRTARVVLVATAIGATAGAGVVLSLVDRPATDGEKTALAPHAIVVTSVQAATAPTAQMVSPSPASTLAVSTAAAAAPATAIAPNKIPAMAPAHPAAIAPPQGPAAAAAPAPAVTASSEQPSSADAATSDLPDGTTVSPDPTKKPKGHATAPNKNQSGLGSVIRQMFSAHAGTSYYPNHGL